MNQAGLARTQHRRCYQDAHDLFPRRQTHPPSLSPAKWPLCPHHSTGGEARAPSSSSQADASCADRLPLAVAVLLTQPPAINLLPMHSGTEQHLGEDSALWGEMEVGGGKLWIAELGFPWCHSAALIIF